METRGIMTVEEAELIIQLAKTPRNRALFSMLYITGARTSELTKSYIYEKYKRDDGRVGWTNTGVREGLKKRDIIIMGDDVHITLDIRKRRKKRLKDEHTIVVSKDTPFMDNILYYISTLNDDEMLFNIMPRRARQILEKIRKHEEFKQHIWIHLFRHTRLMKLARLGASPTDLKDWAGHSGFKNLDRYLSSVPIKKFKDKIR